MPSIYTKTGDKGISSIYDGTRMPKDDAVFQTLGEMDELTTRIGSLKVYIQSISEIERKVLDREYTLNILETIQADIQNFNSHIATHRGKNLERLPYIETDLVCKIENEIDRMESAMPVLTKFILPGESELACRSHLCRTQCRKAERYFTAVKRNLDPSLTTKIEWETMSKYLNRLSDMFFSLSRYVVEAEVTHTN